MDKPKIIRRVTEKKIAANGFYETTIKSNFNRVKNVLIDTCKEKVNEIVNWNFTDIYGSFIISLKDHEYYEGQTIIEIWYRGELETNIKNSLEWNYKDVNMYMPPFENVEEYLEKEIDKIKTCCENI
jgi:hypothetical protein